MDPDSQLRHFRNFAASVKAGSEASTDPAPDNSEKRWRLRELAIDLVPLALMLAMVAVFAAIAHVFGDWYRGRVEEEKRIEAIIDRWSAAAERLRGTPNHGLAVGAIMQTRSCIDDRSTTLEHLEECADAAISRIAITMPRDASEIALQARVAGVPLSPAW